MAQDGDSHFGPQVEILQVMYYPQATPNESGPTCVQPLPCLLAASPFWRTGTPTGKQLDAMRSQHPELAKAGKTVFGRPCHCLLALDAGLWLVGTASARR